MVPEPPPGTELAHPGRRVLATAVDAATSVLVLQVLAGAVGEEQPVVVDVDDDASDAPASTQGPSLGDLEGATTTVAETREPPEITTETETVIPGWFLPVAFLLLLAYYAVPVALWGRTWGKYVLRLRVLTWPSFGVVGWREAFSRGSVLALITAVPPVLAVVPAAVLISRALLRPDNRAYHDLLARTAVVHHPRPRLRPEAPATE